MRLYEFDDWNGFAESQQTLRVSLLCEYELHSLQHGFRVTLVFTKIEHRSRSLGARKGQFVSF